MDIQEQWKTSKIIKNQIWKRENQQKAMETRMLFRRRHTNNQIRRQYWKNGWNNMKSVEHS